MSSSRSLVAVVSLAVALAAFATRPASAQETIAYAAPAFTEPAATALRRPSTFRSPRFVTVSGPAAPRTSASRALTYALQAVDALQTGVAIRRGGRERNPMLRPFAHGGAATMALGFAAGDVVRDALLHRSPRVLRDDADMVQAFANLDGILATHASLRADR